MATTHLPNQPPEAGHRNFRLERVPSPSEVPEIAGQAREAWGVQPHARLDLGRVCDDLGIEVSVVDLEVPDGGAQGFLIPGPDGFRIEVDPEPRAGWPSVRPSLRRQLERHRSRFLIAHELTHTLFYVDDEGGPRRLVPDSSQQEAFCDELARALLVPSDAAAAYPFTPRSVVEIQRRFDVSMELALRGLVSAHRDADAGWLLLHEDDSTPVQWTSAVGCHPTSTDIQAVRRLAERALETGQTEVSLVDPAGEARALYLPQRDQVIVTCRSSPGQTRG